MRVPGSSALHVSTILTQCRFYDGSLSPALATSIQNWAVNRAGWVTVQCMVVPVIEQLSQDLEPMLD